MFPQTLFQISPKEPLFTSFELIDRNPLAKTVKTRTIQKPSPSIRLIHAELKKYLRKFGKQVSSNDGTMPKNSVKKYLQPHRRNRYFYLIDLSNAYSGVVLKKLIKILCELDSDLIKQESELSIFLKKFCLTEENGLIVGAPASPDLFNIYSSMLLDKPFKELCRRYGLTYTRYRDDLLFSSPNKPIYRWIRREIRTKIQAEGFQINTRKVRILDLKKKNAFISGVGIEFGGRLFLPRHYLKKIKTLIQKIETSSNQQAMQKIDGMMGVFWATTDRGRLNRTEQNLIRRYKNLREKFKKAPK